jgi:hypothetical protein
MKDASGVVHHTVGIDVNGESLFPEAAAYGIRKARAHKENLFARLYLK